MLSFSSFSWRHRITLLSFDTLSSLGFCDAVVFSFFSKLSDHMLSFLLSVLPPLTCEHHPRLCPWPSTLYVSNCSHQMSRYVLPEHAKWCWDMGSIMDSSLCRHSSFSQHIVYLWETYPSDISNPTFKYVSFPGLSFPTLISLLL